jgi:hypothetical protein
MVVQSRTFRCPLTRYPLLTVLTEARPRSCHSWRHWDSVEKSPHVSTNSFVMQKGGASPLSDLLRLLVGPSTAARPPRARPANPHRPEDVERTFRHNCRPLMNPCRGTARPSSVHSRSARVPGGPPDDSTRSSARSTLCDTSPRPPHSPVHGPDTLSDHVGIPPPTD